QYWGADRNNWNAVAFTNPKYQNVKDYIDSIHQENAKVMISVWPSFGGKSEIYKELEKNKLLYNMYTFPVQKNVKVYDAFNPKARDIYWKYMYNNLFKAGIDGWWLDAVEPVQKNIIAGDPDKQGQELAYKDKTINTSNVQTYAGSFQSMANAYPLATVQGVYDHQRAVEKDKRAIILTRSGFVGQQRNAAVLWSGDINGTWAVLKAQIPAAINMSYSGMPYWNSDIGGFYTSKFYPKGTQDPKFQELYIRWFQFGVFTAMLRAHGTNIAREIYQFGNPGDKTFDILHQYINLRYTLLPYIYSQTWQTTKTSKPLMKGLAMNYPNDTKVYDNANEFLFGENILVSPVADSITELNASTIKHTTYLPIGDDWFDSWTNKKYSGGQDVTQDVSLEQIPLFVKAGTILPLAPVKQHTDIKYFDTLTLHIYSGKNGSFQLYEDEGDNYNY
ncbi:MAG: xylosidase, partial [Pseudopedobacter saltans]